MSNTNPWRIEGVELIRVERLPEYGPAEDGLHASHQPLDALQYAPGRVVYRLQPRAKVRHGIRVIVARCLGRAVRRLAGGGGCRLAKRTKRGS